LTPDHQLKTRGGNKGTNLKNGRRGGQSGEKENQPGERPVPKKTAATKASTSTVRWKIH